MTWWHRLWRKPNGHTAHIREEAARERAQAQRATARIERLAPALARLPEDEFVERVARAFRARPS